MTTPMTMRLGTLDEVTAIPDAAPRGAAPNDAVNLVWAARQGHPRPWIRYWARTFDLTLFAVVLAAVLYRAGIDETRWNILAAWFALGLWTVLEAVFLSVSGATPGKWLFNIRVTNANGACLTFRRAFERAMMALVSGQGLGVPIISFVTQIVAWRRLRRRGRTSWDEQCETVIRHEPIGVGRVLGIILGSAVFILLICSAIVNLPAPPRDAELAALTPEVQRQFPAFAGAHHVVLFSSGIELGATIHPRSIPGQSGRDFDALSQAGYGFKWTPMNWKFTSGSIHRSRPKK